MSGSFLILVTIVYSLQQYGEATRFLPMIVWDHINPQLKCKSNWLTIPEIDIYDRMNFMCPSLKVAVKLIDGYSRPTSEMNENIFMRKWNNSRNIKELQIELDDNSFCDPGESFSLHQCRDGAEGQSLQVSFTPEPENPSKNYVSNDIVVFFNNGNDGRTSSLGDTTSRCTMVFVANITWKREQDHDLSYGKCLNPDSQICNNISASSSTCKYVKPTTLPPTTPTATSSETTTNQSPNNQETKPTTSSNGINCPTSSPNTPESSTTMDNAVVTGERNSSCGPKQQARSSRKTENGEFFKGFLAGFFALAAFVIIVVIVYSMHNYFKKKHMIKRHRHSSSVSVSRPPTAPPTPTAPPKEPNSNLVHFNGITGPSTNGGFYENEGYDKSPTTAGAKPPTTQTDGSDNLGYRTVSVVEPNYKLPNQGLPTYDQATQGTPKSTEENELDV